MKKEKTYLETRFTAEVLREAIAKWQSMADPAKLMEPSYHVQRGDTAWNYDNLDEFLSDYRTVSDYASANVSDRNIVFSFTQFSRRARVSVQAASRANIESVFAVLESHSSGCALPPDESAGVARSPIVFIGHGRSHAWRDLKDHLQDKHGVRVEAYETGARAGHTIRDILEEMAQKSSFAILVMTAEDEQPDGGFRARQNVIHEAGLFQGHLGFARAILLMEHGVEEFSNVQGIQYIPFGKDNIREAFGDVIATLRREFPDRP